jgi:hypothetical protein
LIIQTKPQTEYIPELVQIENINLVIVKLDIHLEMELVKKKHKVTLKLLDEVNQIGL